ncbi:unnamed protein product, partial [Ectocarpus sp. 12 AP-2014]
LLHERQHDCTQDGQRGEVHVGGGWVCKGVGREESVDRIGRALSSSSSSTTTLYHRRLRVPSMGTADMHCTLHAPCAKSNTDVFSVASGNWIGCETSDGNQRFTQTHAHRQAGTQRCSLLGRTETHIHALFS